MNVLWLSMNSGLLSTQDGNVTYNGGGWISSLQKELETQSNVRLGIAFIGKSEQQKIVQHAVAYYVLPQLQLGRISKMLYYYGGYRHVNHEYYLPFIQQAISDFKPDVIHVFGIENALSCILGHTFIPICVHLQGILNPCLNSFWSSGISKWNFLWPFSIREWVLKNGFLFAYKSMVERAQYEKANLAKVCYFMGRTQWDHAVSHLYAPQSRYFHVDEVMRPVFYENAGKWRWTKKEPLVLISTISETVYKGLDLILKTAQLLKEQGQISFKWKVVGLEKDSRLISYFERALRIRSDAVNVEYLGVLNAEVLCQQELEASFYVHPSYIDNSPNSVCEAQLLGMPVIGTYTGGIPSLIDDDKSGILVPTNDPYLLAFKIQELLQDPQKIEYLGVNGYQAALHRHNRENIVNDLIYCYQQIIKPAK